MPGRVGLNHSDILSQKRAALAEVSGGFAPQAACSRAIAGRVLTLVSVATLLCTSAGARLARASTDEKIDPARGAARSHFVAVDVIGSAVRTEGAWDTAFGGELAVGAMCDECPLAAWAAGVGLLAFAERSGGRIFAEAAAGTRWPIGLLVGASAGPVLELDEVRPPRVGGQASIWLFAGVVPYVRAGAFSEGGVFVDVGLRIPLPAGRW
jgi:hypothetical protein